MHAVRRRHHADAAALLMKLYVLCRRLTPAVDLQDLRAIESELVSDSLGIDSPGWRVF